MVSKLDWELIENRVGRELNESSCKTASLAFLRMILRQHFPSVDGDLAEIITDGAHDRGVDAIHITEREESAEIHLVQSKHQESHKNSGKTINDSEVLKVTAFLNDIFEKNDDLLNEKNQQLSEAVRRIWEIHSCGKICRYFVVFATNGAGLSLTAKEIVSSVERTHDNVSFEVLGPSDIALALKSESKVSEDGDLQVIGKEILERSDGDVRGVIASVSATSFIESITNSPRTAIKRHLFDDNLRVYLGLEGGFNKQIMDTALSPDNYLFWYLNNGITVTCKSFSYNKGHINPTLRMKGFQIVNGAQTSHSLFEAYRRSPESLGEVVLMIRVYATERSDIAERVAIATNSQARISPRDLRANRPVLITMEAAFRERGLFLERKKNQHSDRDVASRIDALRLGQVIMAFHLELPEKCKTDSDDIFSDFFNRIFHESYQVDDLIRLWALYRKIEERRDEYQLEYSHAPESGLPQQHLVYGHWFVLYACGLLLKREGKSRIPDGEEAEELIDNGLKMVADAFPEQKNVAHYQVYRSARHRERIKAELAQDQLDLFYDMPA